MKSRAWLSAVTAVTAVANAYSRWVAVSNIASGTDRAPEAPPEVVLALCRLLVGPGSHHRESLQIALNQVGTAISLVVNAVIYAVADLSALVKGSDRSFYGRSGSSMFRQCSFLPQQRVKRSLGRGGTIMQQAVFVRSEGSQFLLCF